jgi:hypothetical protein
MNYREHKHKVLSKRVYFRSLDKDEIVCPESDDEFFNKDRCNTCYRKECEAYDHN